MAYIFGSIWDRRNRNALNELSKSIEYQGKSIQDLVAKGQLTPTQYAELITTINGHLKSGELSVFDIDKNRGKFDGTYFSSDFLRELNNAEINTTHLLPRSVLSEHLENRSVFPRATTFMKKTGNLFDGEYLAFAMNYSSTTGNINYRDPSGDNPVGILVEVVPGRTYTITTYDDHDRFIAGVTNEPPSFGVGGGFKPVDFKVVNNNSLSTHTFTNSASGRFLLVYLSSNGGRPKVQVEEGSDSSAYVPPYEIDDKEVGLTISIGEEDLEFLETSDINLFDGKYMNGALQVLDGQRPMFRRGNEDEDLAVIQVSPSRTYTVKVHEPDKSSRFVIAGMQEYPDLSVSGWQDAGHLFVQDNALNQYTLDVPDGINYLFVYVSNVGGKPLLQVEEGASASPYTPHTFIPNRLINFSSVQSDSSKTEDGTFTFYDTLPNAYQRPADLENQRTAIANSDSAMVYGWYDELMQQNPGYITKNLKGHGTNSSGELDTSMPIYEYVFKPNFPDVDSAYIPRLLITSSVHGNEKLSVRSLYEVMKQIVDNNTGDDFANFFRNNLEIRVIPLVNPGGYDLNTRYTANGVNLNRNFEPNWSSTQEASGPEPLSENESKILDRWFSDYGQQAIAYIDSHNITGIHETSQGRYGFVWIITPDINMRTMARNVFASLSRQWLQEIESFQEFPSDTMLANISDYNGGMAMEQAYDKHGIFSVVSDPERTATHFYPNMSPNGLELLKVNVDTLGALMLSIVKRFSS